MMNQIHPEPLSGTLVDILEETAARYPEHGIFHVASGDTSEVRYHSFLSESGIEKQGF